MDVEKVKVYRDNSIQVEYGLITKMPEEGEPEFVKIKFKSNRDAHGDFYQALAQLKPHAVKMLEFDEKEQSRIDVRGATFSTTKEGIGGVVLHIDRKIDVSETPIQIDTPHYIEESYGENGDDLNVMPEELVGVLKSFKKEAARYVEGYSDQVEADLED